MGLFKIVPCSEASYRCVAAHPGVLKNPQETDGLARYSCAE